MADQARKQTDKKLSQMERKLEKIYREAQEEITSDWQAYMERGEQRLSTLYDKWQASGLAEDKQAYQDAVRNYTLRNEYYQSMVDNTTTQIAQANITALAYSNNQMPSIYTVNYRQAQRDINAVGLDFSIRSEATIKRLIQDGDIKLPRKKFSIPKDKRWNTKQLNSSVLQGILQGDSMRDISKRILPIVGNNKNAAIRNARTMVTGAENRGRIDSYHEMQDLGIVTKKVWVATPDGRTRSWHLSMDGQEKDIDEPFVDGNGNEIMFPGDPEADPSSVYNCRCTMKTHILGFRKADGRVERIDDDTEESLHDRQMEAERERRASREDRPMTKTSKDLLREPERPHRDAYDDPEEYSKARADWRPQHDEWAAQRDAVIQSWQDAPRKIEDNEGLLKWAESAGITINPDVLQNVDPKLYDDLADTLTEMFTKYPEVKAYQDAFRKYELFYTPTVDYFMEAGAGLNLGGEFKDAGWVYRDVIQNQTSGYTVMGDGTLKTLIRHEYGHTADAYCRSKFSTLNSTYEDVVSGRDARRSAALSEYRKEVTALAQRYGSEYSRVNDLEAFAEGFAEFTSNPHSEYGKAFGEFFRRWYNADEVQ